MTAPPPGPHGGDGARLAATLGITPEEVLDLSMSLNPCAPDVVSLVREHAASIRRYPDPEPATLALANAIGVAPERLVLTNGGSEAIALVAAECPVGAVDEPDFALYARHLERLDPKGPRWRSNPHNPTGALAAEDETADVWDEAFYPLATGAWTRGDRGAVVVGSLTKVFACPGLRAGYVLAPDQDLADRIRARQPRWSASALVCGVLPELLELTDLVTWSAEISKGRHALLELLAAAGLRADRSDAPFVLVRDAGNLRDHLAAHGVLVRDTGSFGIGGGVRVAVPDRAGRERFAEAMTGWHR
jgi:histidinol-phosphate/aromatic aminotransferase/cobyric acid decarboxylase-like protein